MDVLMPQLGETVDEGKVLVWYKKVGDKVEPGENLFEIETEKVSMEVPSTVAGTLQEIRVQVDETAPVGAVVAVIAEEGAQPAASAPCSDDCRRRQRRKPAPQPRAPLHPAHQRPQRRPYVARKQEPFKEVFTPERNYGPAKVGGVETTPYARRLASEQGISLASLRGSGPNGRIVAKDVEAQRGKGAQSQTKALYEAGTYTEQPVDAMRRAIARRLTESKQTIPHFYLTIDLDVDALLAVREGRNSALPAQATAKLSVNDLIIKAWAAALRDVPRANAVWAEDSILQFNRSDIGSRDRRRRRAGYASGAQRGHEIRLGHLARREGFCGACPRQEAQGRRPAGRRQRDLEPRHVRRARILRDHQSAAIDGARSRRRTAPPDREADGGVRFATLMTVTLSCDHRVVDGALGAELLAALRDIVQQRAETLA